MTAVLPNFKLSSFRPSSFAFSGFSLSTFVLSTFGLSTIILSTGACLSLQVVAPQQLWAAEADHDRQEDLLRSRDARSVQDGAGQALSGSNGDTFMEEVVPDNPKPKPKPKPIPIDLSRVGVSVDPHGNIVPLQDSPNDPWAASGVKPFYNHIETTTTLPYAYPIPYAGGIPYGGYPAAPLPGIPYGGYRYGYPGYGYGNRPWGGAFPGNPFNPVYPGYGYRPFGFGPYGAGAYPYGGLINPGFANPYFPGLPGYSPFGVGYLTTGNSATFISNDPVTGAPIPQSQQGNSQTNNFSSSGTLTPGVFSPITGGIVPTPWIPSTSYSTNGMWKAFNLAF
jgi:hypothetical protein